MSGRADETWFPLRFVTVGWAQPWGLWSIRGEGTPAAAFPAVGHWVGIVWDGAKGVLSLLLGELCSLRVSGHLEMPDLAEWVQTRYAQDVWKVWPVLDAETYWIFRAFYALPLAEVFHSRTCLFYWMQMQHKNPQPVSGGACPTIFSGISYIARGEPYQHIPPPSTTVVFRLVCIPPCTVCILWIPQLAGHRFHVTSTLLTSGFEPTSDFTISKGSLKERQEGNTQSSGNHFFACKPN